MIEDDEDRQRPRQKAFDGDCLAVIIQTKRTQPPRPAWTLFGLATPVRRRNQTAAVNRSAADAVVNLRHQGLGREEGSDPVWNINEQL